MALFEIFSKRQKKLREKELPDVYQYAEIPRPLRVQIVHIWRETLAGNREYNELLSDPNKELAGGTIEKNSKIFS